MQRRIHNRIEQAGGIFPNRHKEQQKVNSDSPAQGVGALEEHLKLSLNYLSALET